MTRSQRFFRVNVKTILFRFTCGRLRPRSPCDPDSRSCPINNVADAPASTSPTAPPTGSSADLNALLEGAGLTGVPVTPELARKFGEILRVVVAGVMDVLQSRQRIKDEFRMRMTHFRVADNNPLKFSANVDHALRNLLGAEDPWRST